MGDAAPSRTARSWLVAVVATTLLAATSMVAVAGPAAAATLPDTVSSAPNLSLQACPDGTVLLADSVIPSTAAGSSFTFSKNGLQFPPPPALGYGLVVNDGAGHVTFSSPTIPVAAVALNVTDSQGTAYATALVR